MLRFVAAMKRTCKSSQMININLHMLDISLNQNNEANQNMTLFHELELSSVSNQYKSDF